MCGIAGILREGGGASAADVRPMADAQAHRGPDDAGTWEDASGRVALGHRRLSILDLTPAGHQPMADESGQVCVVYNGEIYNFPALRDELARMGHVFRSRSDTEVLLRGYLAWGDAVVERLRGMFAFGLWDGRTGRLVLARDRLGIKPLYWTEDGGTFAFASELKGIEAGPVRRLSVDVSALWDFLTYAYVPAPKTAWRGVHKLPPASVLVREAGHITIRTYWDVDFGRARARPDAECAEELRERLSRTVAMHLLSDVPVGVLLSGGVDSSLVTAFAARHQAGIRSYCIGFGDASVSEARFAREAAARFGTRHVEEECAAATDAGGLADLAAGFDEPFADASAWPTSRVCRLARGGVPVVLSGDGGDELFGGYRRYGKFGRIASRDVAPRAVQRATAALLAPVMPAGSKARRALNRWGAEDLERYVHLHGGMTRADKRDQLPRAVTAPFSGYDDAWAFRAHWRPDLDPWSRLQYLDLKTYLPDDLLAKVDRMSMRWSLEVRPPLLDHELVEFAAGIPAGQRLPGGEMKGFLKRALHDILGPESLQRGKQGFSIPLDAAGLFAGTPESAAWPEPQRLAWAVLREWTRVKLGVSDPREVLRDGP